MNQHDRQPVVLVTGGTAGVGLVIAKTFVDNGYRVMIAGRDLERLKSAQDLLVSETNAPASSVAAQQGDMTKSDDVARLFEDLKKQFGRLDVLVNCVGSSDRGLIENLIPDRLHELLAQNVVSTLNCCQAAIDLLEQSGGSIVNIGSLASKVGARYLGGYSAAKHALAGMTQQLRLELKPRGIHVGLVSPGPIRRGDAGARYDDLVTQGLPQQASAPGAGARVKGLSTQRVADAVLRCVRKRSPDVVLPKRFRFLLAAGHAFPQLGDWLLLRLTS